MANNERTLQLSIRRTWPDGGCAFEAQGVHGTVYIKKGFFTGPPPTTLTISGLGLIDPAAPKPAAEPKAKAAKPAAAAPPPTAPVSKPEAPAPQAAAPAKPTKGRKAKVAA